MRLILQESRSYHDTKLIIVGREVAQKFLFLITKYYYGSRKILEAQRIIYLKKVV